MVSARIYVLLVLVMCILPIDGFKYAGSLTLSECKAYFASEDVNQYLQALFSCPKKLRPPSRKRISRFEHPSDITADDDDHDRK